MSFFVLSLLSDVQKYLDEMFERDPAKVSGQLTVAGTRRTVKSILFDYAATKEKFYEENPKIGEYCSEGVILGCLREYNKDPEILRYTCH